MRNISLDILKVLLSIMVVAIHCSFYKDYDRDIAHFLNSGLFRIGVPLFLIINGYFFYGVKTTVQFKKWLRRLAMLYAFWMVIYIPIWQPGANALTALIIVNGYFHLWYIINLLYAAICFWYIRRFDPKMQNALIALLFAAGLAMQYVGNYIITDEATFIGNVLDFTPLYRNFLFMCLPLFYIGYKIRETNAKFSNGALAAASVLFFIEIWLNMRYADHESFDILLAYVIFCPILFAKIRDINIPSGNKNLSLFSSAIYLTHPLVLYILQQHYGLIKTPLTVATIGVTLVLALLVVPLGKRLKFIL